MGQIAGQSKSSMTSLWITGTTGTGKTARLIEQLRDWAELEVAQSPQHPQQGVLVFAASSHNLARLSQRLVEQIPELTRAGVDSLQLVTPIRFFQTEVVQFWPLLVEQLRAKLSAKVLAKASKLKGSRAKAGLITGVSAEPPIRLRPEKEQELAAELWRPEIESGRFRQRGVSNRRLVNQALSFLQLAAASGIPHEQISLILQQGLPKRPLNQSETLTSEASLAQTDQTEQSLADENTTDLWNCTGELLTRWWHWCLSRGLITYSIVTELYWRYLLPHPAYQQQLQQRFWGILADDVDEYPAVMRMLFEQFIDWGKPLACTFNPIGAVRLGLRADPAHLSGLAERCQVETLAHLEQSSSLSAASFLVVEGLQNPLNLLQLPDSIQLIQTVSKAQLLRQIADMIVVAVQSGQIKPQDIAIVAPGLDAITRYTLHSILSSKNISMVSLNSQQPLIATASVRALLTLMALVYPGLGRLVEREMVAEMLVVLGAGTQASTSRLDAGLDPVRAGLIADHCFEPHPTTPQLLPITSFPRWDRLGYEGAAVYEVILQWITERCQQQPNPAALLEQAIQRFFTVEALSFDQRTVLQQLLETAQHYWLVESRLQQLDILSAQIKNTQVKSSSNWTPADLDSVKLNAISHSVCVDSDSDDPIPASVGRFIQLLRSGTITANLVASDQESALAVTSDSVTSDSVALEAVTLATVYQYRSERGSHRWQFWLDAGSSLWLTGGVMLLGAPLFLRERPNRAWTAADTLAANQANLEREVQDLLSRATERVYLCHCELGINGEEQSDGLMALVNAAVPVRVEGV